VAVNTNPTDSTSSIANIASNKSDNAIIDYSSDARAFNANTNFDTATADPIFIVDSGASHLVADKKLNKFAVNSDKAGCDWRWKSTRMQATRRFATR
jgi:hypothetical protein